MKLSHSIFAGAVLTLAAVMPAQAIGINGSLPLAGIGTGQNGANLNVSTLITSAFALTSGVGAGDFSPVPLGTVYGTSTIDLTQAGTGFGFGLLNGTFGTFVPTSGVIVQQTANNLDLYVLGTYTAGAGLGVYDPTVTSLRISVNQSGSSVSAAITLNSPALSIPTPDSSSNLALASVAAVGLLGAGAMRRKSETAA